MGILVCDFGAICSLMFNGLCAPVKQHVALKTVGSISPWRIEDEFLNFRCKGVSI
jgi:hypothetical protein